MKSFKVVRVGIVMFGVMSSGWGYAQQAQQQTPPVPASGKGQALVDAREKTMDDQHVVAPPVSERQKKLEADTDKLLALATDLKKQVDKTNKDILSVDVVKKAEEIEKLARSMKNEPK